MKDRLRLKINFILVFILNFFVYLNAGAGSHSTLAADGSYVILVSIDGYRFDYTEKFVPPHLTALMKEGASAQGLIPVFPSKTFPNHYSIITGLYPENHGIIANEFYDPSRPKEDQFYRISNRNAVNDGSWYGGEPIWVAAEKQGMRTGIFFWPGSEATIQGIRPTYFKVYDKKVPNEQRVAQTLRWLQLPPNERPHFLCIYFSDVDSAGHEFGTHSTLLKNAVMKVDQSIGKLLDGVKNLHLPINVIVVSDHGMQDIDFQKTIFLDDLTDLSGLILQGAGALVSIYDSNHISGKIEKVYMDLKKKENHFFVFHRNEMPAHLHYSKNQRIGDLVVIAEAPYSVGTHFSLLKLTKGEHGYDPTTTPTMMGIFYATGPQIKSGMVLKPFENIHIYPMIMKILGLTVTGPIDGDEKVLEPILIKN